MNLMPITSGLAAASVALIALAATAQAQTTYILQDLGTLYGQSEAFALDAAGNALGASSGPDSHFRSVAYEPSLSVFATQPGWNEQYAFAADPAGAVYGTSYSLGAMTSAAFRADSFGVSLLGNFAARAVNASGDVCGTTTTIVNGLTLPRACLAHAGSLTTLPTLGGLVGTGLGIDDAGRVVGSSTTAKEASVRPTIWVNGLALDLGTLGGTNGQAAAISGNTIVGVSQNAAGLRRATRWTVNAAGAVLTRADLGALGTSSSFAFGLNPGGDIVGTSNFHAVLWRGGATIDLNTVTTSPAGWTLERAWAINPDGTIVGTGSSLGFPRAFKLSPSCPTDFNHDGFVTGDDFDGYVQAFVDGLASADFNHDGFVTGDDFDSFVAAFGAGC